MWLIAFAGELGDGVSRPLPHGILDTSEDTQVRGFPQKSGLVCAWTFLYLSRSVAGARGVRFRREPTSLTFVRGKYERKLFLKSQKLFLKSWKLFLKSQKLFLNLGPKPRNHLQNQDCFYQSQPLDKDSSQSLKVQRLPQTSEPCSHREREAATQAPFILFRSMFILFRSMFFDSSSQNQSLFLSYSSICKEFQYVIMCLYVSIFVNLGFVYLYWYIVLFDDLRHSKGITETVSNRFPLLAR